MKASRLTAVGLVAAAGLWIASGHFLPHESAESRAAVRSGEGEATKASERVRARCQEKFSLWGNLNSVMIVSLTNGLDGR